MKKILLSMCMAAACGSMATAGITAIMGDNIKYTGTADEIVRVPTGARGDNCPIYTDAFTIDWETETGKSMVSMTVGSFHWYSYSKAILAPTEGMTITKVRMIVRDPDYFQSLPDEDNIPGFKLNGNVYTWTGSVSFPEDIEIQPILYGSDVKADYPNINGPRPYIIEVEYSGTPKNPLMPVPSTIDRMITADTQITLTSGTPGVKIYYTTSMEEWPDNTTKEYTGPITLTEDCTLMAVAIDSKNNYSSTLIMPYTVVEAGSTIVNFNFTSLDGLTLKNTTWADHSSGQQISLAGETLQMKDATITTDPNYNSPYIYAPGTTCGPYGDDYLLLRLGAKMGFKVDVKSDEYITGALITGGTKLTAANFTLVDGVEGTLKVNPTDYYSDGGLVVRYIPAETPTTTFSAYRKAGTVQLENIWVAYKDPNSAGIDAIEMDSSNAPVVYYNLQGMQVAADNLTPGIYVKRQGSKAEKILVK